MDAFQVSRSFDDPDEAAQAISGTTLEVSVLGPASGAWSLTEVIDGDWRLMWGRAASPFSGSGTIHRDAMLLCWPMSDDTAAWSVNGRPVHGATLMRLASGADYACLTNRPLQWAAMVGPAPPDFEGKASFSAREIGREAMARVRELAREAVHLARADPGIAGGVPLGALLASLGALASREPFAPRRGGHRIGPLVELVRSQRHELLDAAGLARIAGLDERTLRREFASHFGISVGRYLRLLRLNDVRRDLTRPGAVESVTQAAIRHGFFDLGRFAANYRRTFGENPSATLSRSRRALRLARLRDPLH